MKLFNTLSLEISSLCNRACKFCPVAYNTRPDEKLSAYLFDKVLTELAALKYNGRIELYIYNEPLKDLPYLLHAIEKVRARVPRACIMIATNGDYLRGPENITKLYDAGLNQLLINCYSHGLFEKRAGWVTDTIDNGVAQVGNVYSVLGAKAKVIQMLDKSDPAAFGTGIFRIINRAGNIPTFAPALTEPVERMCVKPFRLLNINWQGDALICCQDYHGEMAFENVGRSTLVELWNHPVINTYREHLLRKDRSLPLCNKCDCHSGAYSHNVPIPDGEFASRVFIEKLHYPKEAQVTRK